jgi:hypothetical protein
MKTVVSIALMIFPLMMTSDLTAQTGSTASKIDKRGRGERISSRLDPQRRGRTTHRPTVRPLPNRFRTGSAADPVGAADVSLREHSSLTY